MSQPLFSFQERIGYLFTIEAATLSICAVSIILLYALCKWVWMWRKDQLSNSEASDSILFLNLMFADLIQGIGTMPNVKWMNDGFITEGELCTAQAALKQVGIVGVAMTSLAIALYTFIVLRRDRPIPKHTAKFVVAAIWIFTAIVIGIPNAAFRNKRYYGRNAYWCWIVPELQPELISTEYLWVWVAAGTMLVLYSIMFFFMLGSTGMEEEEPVQNDVELDAIGESASQDLEQINEVRKTKRVARKMLFYPAIYIGCILPNSVSRWMSFTNANPPFKFTFAANTIFALSGFLNFGLFLLTRPSWVVGRQGERRRQSNGHGRPPPQIPSPSSERKASGSHSSPSSPRLSTTYTLTQFQSPKFNRALPPDRGIIPSTSDENYGFLPP